MSHYKECQVQVQRTGLLQWLHPDGIWINSRRKQVWINLKQLFIQQGGNMIDRELDEMEYNEDTHEFFDESDFEIWRESEC